MLRVVESVGVEQMVVRCCDVRMMSYDRSRWWSIVEGEREGGRARGYRNGILRGSIELLRKEISAMFERDGSGTGLKERGFFGG